MLLFTPFATGCTTQPYLLLILLYYSCFIPDGSQPQLRFFSMLMLTWYQVFYNKYFKDVSREFDEFQVNTHLCKLRYYVHRIRNACGRSIVLYGRVLNTKKKVAKLRAVIGGVLEERRGVP